MIDFIRAGKFFPKKLTLEEEIQIMNNITALVRDYQQGLITRSEALDNIKHEASKITPR